MCGCCIYVDIKINNLYCLVDPRLFLNRAYFYIEPASTYENKLLSTPNRSNPTDTSRRSVPRTYHTCTPHFCRSSRLRRTAYRNTSRLPSECSLRSANLFQKPSTSVPKSINSPTCKALLARLSNSLKLSSR